ncbi:uncharacterized protein LOC121873728 [Homarus americanus]|uniref:uncharacterized protein LOC121873728 n=1 Tax=Homarus americanus TaxID=6706 RepID=UPI001C4575B8|nr:uncharacterized protein LOC121873728 [Homarus americanus]
MEGPPASSPEFDRCVTPLCLLSSGELNPLWKEVDVAGVVLRVGLLNKGLQLVHIVDHHINILTLKFWGGLKEYGVENIVAIGSVICVLNGNWRGHAGGRFGSIHVTELTFITSSPRSAHLLEAVAHLKNSIKVRIQDVYSVTEGSLVICIFPPTCVSKYCISRGYEA